MGPVTDGAVVLRGWVEKLRKLESMGDRVIADVAKEIERELQTTARNERTPDGRAWPEKKTQGRALAHASDKVRVRVARGAVVVSLTGHYARHHLGAVRGKVRRELIPTGKIPDAMTKAIRRVVEREFRAIMGSE